MYQNDDEKLKKFFNKTTEDENNKKYRSHLVHLLGDKLSTADKLYATVGELKKKAKEFGYNLEETISAIKRKDVDKLADISKDRNDAYGDFARNYIEMKKKNIKGADGFYHAKANCQAGQKGEIGKAIQVDIAKEIYDTYNKNYKDKKGTFRSNGLDSLKDLKNDFYGLKQGIQNPKGNCDELVKKFKVKGLR